MNETWIEDGECLPDTLDWFGFDYYDYTKDFQNKLFNKFFLFKLQPCGRRLQPTLVDIVCSTGVKQKLKI